MEARGRIRNRSERLSKKRWRKGLESVIGKKLRFLRIALRIRPKVRLL